MNAHAAKLPTRRELGTGVQLAPLTLALGAAFFIPREPAWLCMWIIATALWLGCKWAMTFRTDAKPAGSRLLAYWLLWPGMDPKPFCDVVAPPRPQSGEWFQAALLTALGVTLVFLIAPGAIETRLLLGGWIGWTGIILLLHFGTFHLLALGLQSAGIPVRPIMRNPLAATSLADFWGRRWNHAFQEVAHRLLFKPVARKAGAAWATLVCFFASGLVHELVITLPAGGGYGLPTLYFLIQGAGLLAERGRVGHSLGLGKGWAGRIYAVLIAALPVGLLFPPPFIERVMVPFLGMLNRTQVRP